MSTLLPLTLLIKLPLIHINIPASAEINPLNHLNQKEGELNSVEVERQTGSGRGEILGWRELTWPYHHVWNTADFPLSQSKDLMQTVTWREKKKSANHKCSPSFNTNLCFKIKLQNTSLRLLPYHEHETLCPLRRQKREHLWI